LTLIGALLTAIGDGAGVERGTLEALLVTPVRSEEILLGKTLPYFLLGLIGALRCASCPPSFCSTYRCAVRSGYC